VKEVNLDQELLLIKGLAKNDKKATETIYRLNFSVIQAMILNNNGDEDDAKDIFQESMVVLFEKSRLADFELTCSIKTFLYSVSRRLWLKKLTHYNKTISHNDDIDIVMVDDDIEGHEKKDAEYELMQQSIIKLGEPCKSILEAFYFKKQNMQEIAENFGYTNAENAKNQKYKCLMRLKKLFFKQIDK